MSEARDMRYDPDVLTGTLCHFGMGYHKHGPIGPEPWSGLVIAVPLDGSQPMMKWMTPPGARRGGRRER